MKLNEDIIMRFESSKRTALAIFHKDEVFPEIFPVKYKFMQDKNTLLITDAFIVNSLKKVEGSRIAAITFWEGIKGYQVKGEWKICTQDEHDAVGINVNDTYNVTPFKQEAL